MSESTLEQIKQFLTEGEPEKLAGLVQQALDRGIEPSRIHKRYAG